MESTRRLRKQMHLSLCGLRREQQGCASRHLPRHRPQESQTGGLELWRFRAAPNVHSHESTRLPAHHLLGHYHHAPQSRTGTQARRHCCISMPTSQCTTEVSEVSDFVTSAALVLPITDPEQIFGLSRLYLTMSPEDLPSQSLVSLLIYELRRETRP